MPKQAHEIKLFNKGIVASAASEDIDDNAAIFSKDVDDNTFMGSITGIEKELEHPSALSSKKNILKNIGDKMMTVDENGAVEVADHSNLGSWSSLGTIQHKDLSNKAGITAVNNTVRIGQEGTAVKWIGDTPGIVDNGGVQLLDSEAKSPGHGNFNRAFTAVFDHPDYENHDFAYIAGEPYIYRIHTGSSSTGTVNKSVDIGFNIAAIYPVVSEVSATPYLWVLRELQVSDEIEQDLGIIYKIKCNTNELFNGTSSTYAGVSSQKSITAQIPTEYDIGYTNNGSTANGNSSIVDMIETGSSGDGVLWIMRSSHYLNPATNSDESFHLKVDINDKFPSFLFCKKTTDYDNGVGWTSATETFFDKSFPVWAAKVVDSVSDWDLNSGPFAKFVGVGSQVTGKWEDDAHGLRIYNNVSTAWDEYITNNADYSGTTPYAGNAYGTPEPTGSMFWWANRSQGVGNPSYTNLNPRFTITPNSLKDISNGTDSHWVTFSFNGRDLRTASGAGVAMYMHGVYGTGTDNKFHNGISSASSFISGEWAVKHYPNNEENIGAKVFEAPNPTGGIFEGQQFSAVPYKDSASDNNDFAVCRVDFGAGFISTYAEEAATLTTGHDYPTANTRVYLWKEQPLDPYYLKIMNTIVHDNQALMPATGDGAIGVVKYEALGDRKSVNEFLGSLLATPQEALLDINRDSYNNIHVTTAQIATGTKTLFFYAKTGKFHIDSADIAWESYTFAGNDLPKISDFTLTNQSNSPNGIDVTEWQADPDGSAPNFPQSLAETSTQRYKISYVYNNLDESPLSQGTWNTVDVASTANGSDELKIDIVTDIMDPDDTKRVTAINLYRSDSDTSPFRRVSSSSLFKGAHTFLDPNDGSTQLKITIIDIGSLGGSYEALTTIPESLERTAVNYEVSVNALDSLVVGGCSIPDAPLGEDFSNFLFKSIPHWYDSFDYTDINSFTILPEKPIALAMYNARVYAFSKNRLYRINPLNMTLEDTYEGIGIVGPNAVASSPYGLCFADNNSIYLLNQEGFQNIGVSIIKGGAYFNETWGQYWKNHTLKTNFTGDEIVRYNPRENSFYISFFETVSTETKGFFWNYSLVNKSWNLVEAENKITTGTYPLPANKAVRDISTSDSGEIVYVCHDDTPTNKLRFLKSDVNGDRKAWEWTSKELAFQSPVLDKFIYKIKIPYAGTTPVVKVSADRSTDPGSWGTIENISTDNTIFEGKITSATFDNNGVITNTITSKKVKFIYIKVEGFADETGVSNSTKISSVLIVYRPKSPK
tara:strand:+ start:405 stop:4226 length:3822 start_codon:yes stop_codon:yes gene_type:complete